MKNQKITIFLIVVIIFLVGFIFTEQNNPVANSESLFEKQERCANNRENAKKKDSKKLIRWLRHIFTIYSIAQKQTPVSIH
ncbi:MAG TPA: hypothetical protein ENI61_01840, partial [Ignavibacteria bacterium]|nr:hypothetical protein [Ignavibacteria bacterium]